ncbi:hypothetical protein J7L67_06210 [bacterium]|nr:hypothetical protein [bacterium]
MKTFAALSALTVLTLFLFGCAANQTEKDDSSYWARDVIIEFTRDTSPSQKKAFYKKYNLEFIAQYDNDTVKCRILTGESIDDFIDSLSVNPKIKKIEPAT